jgi:CheY-like chemotaxis protein
MSASHLTPRRVRVLVVEDSRTQAALIAAILDTDERLELLHILEDGEQALAYLRREGAYEDDARPDFVLLDLHLPKKDGIEVLHELKADAELRSIPVVMLTSSDRQDDVLNCYAAGASSYITKPVDQEGMERVLKLVSDYWGEANVPPQQRPLSS